MNKIKIYLNCGALRVTSSRSAVDLVVLNFTDIETKIIPLIETYSLQGNKKLDYLDFCKAASIIKNKEHLTTLASTCCRGRAEVEGVELLKKLKSGMNTGRK